MRRILQDIFILSTERHEWIHDLGISNMFFPDQFEFQISNYFGALMVTLHLNEKGDL